MDGGGRQINRRSCTSDRRAVTRVHEHGCCTAAAARDELRATWSRLLHGESGQGLIEYVLIISVVSLGAVVALGFSSGKINTLFSKAGNSVNNVTVAVGAGTSSGDTTAPIVTIPSPSGSNVDHDSNFGGACGTLPGDASTITLTVTRTSGSGSPQVFVNGVSVNCTAGAWTYNPSGSMAENRDYTSVATQSDSSGNVGTATVNFHTKD